MKVLLINPLSIHEILDNTPSIIPQGRGDSPPLGLLYLAGYLEKFSENEVSVIDCQVEQLDMPSLRNRIQAFKPDVVGMTAMTMTLVDVVDTIRQVKGVDADIKVILGGPHVHLFPEETIGLEHVDFLVLGEGELTFKKLLDAIDNPARLRQIPGLIFHNNGEIVRTGACQLIEDLDELPFPARHLVPYKKYSSVLSRRDPVTSIFTSRGCPFKCTFCDRPHLGSRFRARSAGNVADEFETCVKMGVSEFLVYDDTFTINRKRVLDICSEISRRNLDILFHIRARVDTVDEKMLAALGRAGCTGIHYGIEAGTEKILKVLNKQINIDKAAEIFKATKKHGIATLAYFMIGNPTETREDIEQTFKVMKRLNPDYVHLTVLTPYPGTQIYRQGLESGIIEKDVWREFARNPDSSFAPPCWRENFIRDELMALAAEGYRRFYFRTSYVLRSFFKTRSIRELRKKIRAGLQMIGCSSKDSRFGLNGALSPLLLRRRIAAVRPYIANVKNILDVGCGMFSLEDILPEGTKYTGVDVDEDVVRFNRGRFAYKFICRSMEAITPAELGKGYDLVLMLASLEHFREPVQVLRKITGAITERGRIVLTTPHPTGDRIMRWGAGMGLCASDKDQHQALLNRKSLEELASAVGCRLTVYKRFLFGLNQLGVMERK